MKTIKDFAKEEGVSYQAIHSQITRYHKELDKHIITRNRVKYLDEYAVEFLQEKRRKSPVIMVRQDKEQEIDSLKLKISDLMEQLIAADHQIASLNKELRATLETKIRCELLLEDRSKIKTENEQLKEEKERLTADNMKITAEKERLSADITRITTEKERLTADNMKITAEKESIAADITRITTELNSYRKSIFGFYRKKS